MCDDRPGVDSSVPAVEYHFPPRHPVSGQDVAALSGTGVQALTNPGELWRMEGLCGRRGIWVGP